MTGAHLKVSQLQPIPELLWYPDKLGNAGTDGEATPGFELEFHHPRTGTGRVSCQSLRRTPVVSRDSWYHQAYVVCVSWLRTGKAVLKRCSAAAYLFRAPHTSHHRCEGLDRCRVSKRSAGVAYLPFLPTFILILACLCTFHRDYSIMEGSGELTSSPQEGRGKPDSGAAQSHQLPHTRQQQPGQPYESVEFVTAQGIYPFLLLLPYLECYSLFMYFCCFFSLLLSRIDYPCSTVVTVPGPGLVWPTSTGPSLKRPAQRQRQPRNTVPDNDDVVDLTAIKPK